MDPRLLLRDKFIASNSARAKYRVRADFIKQSKNLNVYLKKICALDDGLPSYDDVNTIFQANGVYRKAETVRGIILLLNSELFKHPADFAEVWNAYSQAAEKLITLSREEVSFYSNV